MEGDCSSRRFLDGYVECYYREGEMSGDGI